MNSLLLPRRAMLRLMLVATPMIALQARAATAPPLMLANVYRPGVHLDDFWVSEKYDGVRGYWDGSRLFMRGGGAVAAPAWFTAGWPATPMDGELWAGHGAFNKAVSTVRQQQPVDAAWHGMRFLVFDLPAQGGNFDERLTALRTLLVQGDPSRLVLVAQAKVESHAALLALLRKTVQAGGEGLMLHRGNAPYLAERNDNLLKFKPYLDAEAQVVAHVPGKGKHEGRLGALMVQTPEGKRFKLGTGFTDAQRGAPPAPGAWVVYRYRDLTLGGIPRFASFLRLREDI